ncbi:hypothetical protein, partial [Escherichia coli]|uniref:hypothetical protein n=1 Tax=Escherichia coli TaxID=562 RepID=UPI00195338FF
IDAGEDFDFQVMHLELQGIGQVAWAFQGEQAAPNSRCARPRNPGPPGMRAVHHEARHIQYCESADRRYLARPRVRSRAF